MHHIFSTQQLFLQFQKGSAEDQQQMPSTPPNYYLATKCELSAIGPTIPPQSAQKPCHLDLFWKGDLTQLELMLYMKKGVYCSGTCGSLVAFHATTSRWWCQIQQNLKWSALLHTFDGHFVIYWSICSTILGKGWQWVGQSVYSYWSINHRKSCFNFWQTFVPVVLP